MKLQEILSVLPFYKINNYYKNLTINEIQLNHSKIEKDDLFICIKGFTVDGHDFAEEAVKNGASVIIAERELPILEKTVIIVPSTIRALAILAAKYYDFPTNKMTVIGITGTNGKTTTSHMINEMLMQDQRKTGLIGSLHAKIMNEIIPIDNTTPDALTLQSIFDQMVEKEVDTCIMEVSSHALDIGRIYGCDFNIAVFTNLTQDHLDYHQNMDDYLRAKTLLFTLLGNQYSDRMKYAVMNNDDDHSSYIMKHTAQHLITYGIKRRSDIMAKNITMNATNTSFQLETPVGSVKVNSKLVGTFNIYNMLATATIGFLYEIPLLKIKQSLEQFRGVDGRFELVHGEQDFIVIVDYAHTPDSLANVLDTINEFKQAKVYVVLGTGGDRDRTKRAPMAKVATEKADFAIFTTDNPRTENPTDILHDMTSSLVVDNFIVIENREEAIFQAIIKADKNDIVLIAGKGHETYQEINGVRYPFDDREVAKRAIKQKVNRNDMYD